MRPALFSALLLAFLPGPAPRPAAGGEGWHSFHHLVFSGGGQAFDAGPAALLANPATLPSPHAPAGEEAPLPPLPQGEAGFLTRGGAGLGQAYGLFSFPAPLGLGGLGYAQEISGSAQGAVFAGFALEAGPRFSVGAVGRAEAREGEGQVDLAAGARLRPWKSLSLGGSVSNLLESRFSAPRGPGPAPHRLYALALGYHHGHSGLGYDFATSDLASFEYAHTLSALMEGRLPRFFGRLGLGGIEAFGVAGSLRLPERYPGDPLSAGAGLELFFPLFGHGVKAGYGVGGIALTRGSEGGAGSEAAKAHAGPVQALILGLSLGAHRDRRPPKVSVTVDQSLWSRSAGETGSPPLPPPEPAAVSAPDPALALYAGSGSPSRPALHFRLWAEDESGALAGWAFLVCRADGLGRPGKVVYRLQGKDLPPLALRWQGEDRDGEDLPGGYYAYRLVAVDRAGNQAKTPWRLLELR